jgi:diguanylate cyclase (GGDEF)-like protein
MVYISGDTPPTKNWRCSRKAKSALACRCGGEELAVILPETDFSPVAIAAERLRQRIEMERDIAVEESTIFGSDGARQTVPGVTISIGVASYPAHATDTEGLIMAADRAMFAAKSAGKNRVMVSDLPQHPPARRSGRRDSFRNPD